MTLRSLGIASLTIASLMLSTSCGDEGPGEKAGRKIDQAVDSLRGEPDLGERINRTLSGGGAAERAGKDVDDAIERAKKEAENAQESVRKALDDS